jgi:putative Mg2+ transporter-C (MgtC) family protein
MIDPTLQLDLSVRMLVASVLGLLIGLEREIHGHPAGLRTHMLVSLGSALFTILSVHGFGQGPGSGIDPTRIAAQIVTGIGFLGAGAILKDGIVIRGLTTAASLWATAAVGIAAGAGEWVVAGVATLFILVSLWPINALAERLRYRGGQPEVQLRLSLERLDAMGEVSALLVSQKLEIGSLATERTGKSSYRVDITVRGRTSAAIARTIEAIDKIAGVDVMSASQPD